jgi:hypothetical protein
MKEFIYHLHPLRSVVHTSHPSGHLHTMVYLEQGVKDHLFIICRSVRHHFLCSMHLVTTPSRQLLSRLGAFPVLDNLFLCRVLFLHRGHTQELLPHQGLRILGRDPFPHQECQFGVILLIINGTPDNTPCLSLGPTWGNPFQIPTNVMHAHPSMSYFGNQPMISPHTQNLYAGHGHGFYQNPGHCRIFPSNLVPVKLQAPFSPVITNNPNYLSWQPCIFQT